VDNKEESLNSTEQQILEAAKSVFLEKGMDGARMQEIADRAGINKALLHYYFRSKDKLFNHIFEDVFKSVFDAVNQSLHNNLDLFTFIEVFVHNYIKVLSQNPYLPNFIVNEMNRNPQFVDQFHGHIHLDKDKLEKLIEKSVEEGKIVPVSVYNLLADLMGMCIFPIIAKPMILVFLFNKEEKQYQEFLHSRSEHIVSVLKKALIPDSQLKKLS